MATKHPGLTKNQWIALANLVLLAINIMVVAYVGGQSIIINQDLNQLKAEVGTFDNLNAGTFQLKTATTNERCVEELQGRFKIEKNVGAADLLFVCIENASNSYNWVQIAIG